MDGEDGGKVPSFQPTPEPSSFGPVRCDPHGSLLDAALDFAGRKAVLGPTVEHLVVTLCIARDGGAASATYEVCPLHGETADYRVADLARLNQVLEALLGMSKTVHQDRGCVDGCGSDGCGSDGCGSDGGVEEDARVERGVVRVARRLFDETLTFEIPLDRSWFRLVLCHTPTVEFNDRLLCAIDRLPGLGRA